MKIRAMSSLADIQGWAIIKYGSFHGNGSDLSHLRNHGMAVIC